MNKDVKTKIVQLNIKSSIMESKWGRGREEGEVSGKGFGNLVIEFIFIPSCYYQMTERGIFCIQIFNKMERGENSEDKGKSRGIKLLRESSIIGNIEKLMSLHCSDPFL